MQDWTTTTLTLRSPIFRPLLILGIGALVLAAGIALARAWLPEWHSGPQEKAFYVQRYRDLAARAGIRLASGEPRVFLTSEKSEDRSEREAERLDRADAGEQSGLGAGLRVEVSHSGVLPGETASRRLQIDLAPMGEPVILKWSPVGLFNQGVRPKRTSSPTAPTSELVEAMARLLLAPGERLSERRSIDRDVEIAYTLPGSDPPQRIDIKIPNGGTAVFQRELVDRKDLHRQADEAPWQETLPDILFGVSRVSGLLLTIWLLFRLLFRRRIDFS